MRFLFKSLIRFYRLCLSPLMSPTCRYLPSCSDYAEQAIEKNGAWKGGWLALSRLTRCHPYGAQGYDPVPDLTDIHHPWWAPWRYGRWDGGHITEKFHEKEVSSPMKESGKWDFWIDRGGTFTDIIARSPEGEIKTGKYLSETPLLSKDAALQAIRQTFHLEPSDPIPISRIASLKMGTTLATNALLQKKGEPTFLMITKGFRDALKIGTQARSDIFALNIIKPDSLYIRVSEVSERVRADGSVERPLDGNQAKSLLEDAYQAGLRAVAIVFMHAGRRPGHEVEVAEIARRTGFTQISVSHQTSASMKLISRGETTVVDAYLSPLLRHYVTRLMSELGETGEGTSGCAPRPMFMQSSGGLTSAELFCGKDAILSGPAGGVVAAVKVAKIAGFDKIIAFDMGGTSTDVSHFNGVFEQVFETQVAGVKLCTPMMHIQTVAAGGGSILHFDQNRFQVGPQSAGANPGPKCYRSQGPLTVTDANLIVGKLVPEFFPKVFGTQQNEALDGEAVTAAFEALSNRIADGRSAHQIADGFIRIAVDNMANAIAKISTQRGYDVSDYTLVSFGGAAGQHVCLVAEALGIRRILSHPLSGLLSAYGMGLADVSALREKIIERPLGDPVLEQIRHLKKELMAENRKELAGQGIEANCTRTHMRLLMRYQGTDSPLALIPEELNSVNIKQDFEALHKQRFGFISEDREIMIGSIVVETVGGGGDIGEGDQQLTTAPLPEPLQTHRFFSRSHWHEAAIFRRTDLLPGHIISAPALIVEDHQMLVIEAGWKAEVTPKNHLLIERQDRAQKDSGTSLQADPVMLEIFHNLFMSIAEQMGVTLQNTAQSVNMKERLDFSTALFDKNGHLIANAPHIPVHLGSMDRSVKTIMRDMGSTLRPGDVAMLNAPYNGGTHLPDITVVTPVFDDPGKEILFYLASRGHHADIGGLSPGSMSPRATHIEEEGVYIDSCKLVEGGHFCETSVHARLIGAPYPARNPVQNIADLKAQVAANQKGIRELKKMLAHYGRDLVEAYMGHVQDHAESQVRAVIAGLEDAEFKIEMDQGCEIAVALHVDKKARTLQIDFTGTSAEQANNFNAPEPVTRAAVLYVFRCLIEDNIPLNAGCMRPIEITIPEDSMLSPRYPAAVAAGNVETSQVVTNALFAALGVLGSAQGTMNNLTFGNDQLQYYETLCSGAPAGPGFDGSDAVHTHMTNSHLTDPEILEQRFPVVIENFAICPGSGGRGKWSAGDGTIREIRFLETMSCAILSGFRKIPPFGTKGGEPGKVGENKLYRKDGSIETLESSTEIILHEGDRIMIRTPTGGGFGPSQETEV